MSDLWPILLGGGLAIAGGYAADRFRDKWQRERDAEARDTRHAELLADLQRQALLDVQVATFEWMEQVNWLVLHMAQQLADDKPTWPVPTNLDEAELRARLRMTYLTGGVTDTELYDDLVALRGAGNRMKDDIRKNANQFDRDWLDSQFAQVTRRADQVQARTEGVLRTYLTD